jgi:hypothetical protein
MPAAVFLYMAAWAALIGLGFWLVTGHWNKWPKLVGFYFAWMTVWFIFWEAWRTRLARFELKMPLSPEVQEKVLEFARRFRFKVMHEGNAYMQLAPTSGLLKLDRDVVEIWFPPESVIVEGPHWFVKRLGKRLLEKDDRIADEVNHE